MKLKKGELICDKCNGTSDIIKQDIFDKLKKKTRTYSRRFLWK